MKKLIQAVASSNKVSDLLTLELIKGGGFDLLLRILQCRKQGTYIWIEAAKAMESHHPERIHSDNGYWAIFSDPPDEGHSFVEKWYLRKDILRDLREIQYPIQDLQHNGRILSLLNTLRGFVYPGKL